MEASQAAVGCAAERKQAPRRAIQEVGQKINRDHWKPGKAVSQEAAAERKAAKRAQGSNADACGASLCLCFHRIAHVCRNAGLFLTVWFLPLNQLMEFEQAKASRAVRDSVSHLCTIHRERERRFY